LLNLSFLPLGLGKSSSKSPSVNKTKRMSLLNLNASHLFANPKILEQKRESVHMTGYTRRRSISNPAQDDVDEDGPHDRNENNNGTDLSSVIEKASTNTGQVTLAKLGRSKSSMSEFSKRPKLRLKILPPTVPPPVPMVHHAENLPSPPPSPVPSPPSTPVTAPVVETKVVLRRLPKSPPRPRIIALPSTDSVDSGDPTSPQYLTPAGGCSPQPDESAFPLLSPTLPPTSTPLCSSQRAPGTPPIWPLQPVWPLPIGMHQKGM